MGRPVLIVGPTGSGKSRSIKNLDPNKTFIINIMDKELPFKGNKFYKIKKDGKTGNLISTYNPTTIIKAMNQINEKRPEVNCIVIDDFQYMLSMSYYNRIDEGGWGKWNDIFKYIMRVILAAKELRDDITIFILTHSEDVSEYNRKAKTIGKAVDNYISLEGLFTVVLWTKLVKSAGEDSKMKYHFVTQGDGINTAKSPEGMFDFLIDNDLSYVLGELNKYYS